MGVDRRTLALQNRRISIGMERMTDRLLAGTGLTAAQGYLLCFILNHAQEGTSLTAIHREFGFSKATLCRILKYLRENGYVRVETCARDERRKLLFQTEKSAQVRSCLMQATERACGQVYRDFSKRDLEELGRLQQKMMRNLSEPIPDGNVSERSEDFEESTQSAAAI